jgi:hypothetical protein
MNRIFQARFHFFKSLLALDGAFGIIEYFEIDQPVDFIFLGKAFRLFQAMLSHATDKVVGHADVKRASDAAGEDINVGSNCVPASAASGIPGRPVKPGDDSSSCSTFAGAIFSLAPLFAGSRRAKLALRGPG